MAMVFAESKSVEVKQKHRPGRACRYFKMVVCPDFTAETAKSTIEKSVEEKALKITDGYHTYKKIAKEMGNFQTEITPCNQAHIKLPWVHACISNLKRVLNGIFHHIKPEYLQNYIDEFCYKLNRRNFGNKIVERGLIALTLT